MNTQPLRLQSFEELEHQLRSFHNWLGPDEMYDFGGVVHLLLACLDNLQAYALETELRDLQRHMTGEQRQFFMELAHHVQAAESEDL